MKLGLQEFGLRGVRFFASAAATTYFSLRAAVAPASNLDVILPSTLPGSTSALTMTSGGQIGYATLGTGTVTSVALVTPSFLSVTGSPITTNGTLTVALESQVAGTVFAGPTSGGATAPTFRALVSTDIPTLTASFISNFDTQVRTNRLDQLTAPTATVSFGGQVISNVGTPSVGTDVATKAYVDSASTSANTYKGTADASAANPTAATGVGVWSNGWLYRVTTSGSTAFGYQLNTGDYVIYNGATWDKIDSTDPAVTGTTNRITVTGTADTGFVADISASYVGQSSITTLGTITTGVWNGSAIDVARGGTGATTSTGARTALGAAGVSVTQFTDATLSAGILVVTHNLGNQFTQVTIYDSTNKQIIPDDVTATSSTVATIDLTTYGTITGNWQAVCVG